MSDTTDNYEKEIKVLADAYIESTGSHNRPDITRHDYLRGIIDFCDTIHKRVVEEKDSEIEQLRNVTSGHCECKGIEERDRKHSRVSVWGCFYCNKPFATKTDLLGDEKYQKLWNQCFEKNKTIAKQSAEIERLRELLVVANGCLKEVGEYPITVAKITEALKPKE